MQVVLIAMMENYFKLYKNIYEDTKIWDIVKNISENRNDCWKVYGYYYDDI